MLPPPLTTQTILQPLPGSFFPSWSLAERPHWLAVHAYIRDQLSVKSQRVIILGFVGHMVTVTVALLL